MDDYARKLVDMVDSKLEKVSRNLRKISTDSKRPISDTAKKIYTLMTENIELRKMLNECNRKIFRFDESNPPITPN
jgi:hypothetical protein